jgi:hypothetical protein
VIDQAMLLLRNTLNAHLTLAVPGQDASAEDAVVFLDGDKTDPISFKIGAVTMLLINVEQEPVLRAANPYQRTGPDGTPYQSRPDIRLNLRVLFVARFKQYEQALARLSQILSFFQSTPVLDAHSAPSLPAAIPQLTMELVTQPLNEQNDLWNALRATFQPSLLYRVRMLVFEDRQVDVIGPVTGAAERKLLHASSTAT